MKTEFKVSLIVIAAAISFLALGQTIPTGDLKKFSLSGAKLKTLDSVLTEAVAREEIAGGVALIAQNGKVGYLKSFGVKDLETNQAMTSDDLFRIASMTKAITTVAVMILFEEGYFALDDPVSKFIPEFSEMNVMVIDTAKKTYQLEKTRRAITIRHLLNHTSGIAYDFLAPEVIRELYVQNKIYSGLGPTTGTVEEMVKRLAKLPLVNHPGEKWQYGLSTDVLGYLVEKLSGMPLNVFLSTRIFTPLGMTDTNFFPPDEDLNRLATLYGLNKSNHLEKIVSETMSGPITYSDQVTHSRNQKYFSGGAGLVSNASDYFKFLQMLLNRGTYNGNRILSKKTVELITTEQVDNNFDWWKGYGFGFGFAISKGSKKTGNLESEGSYSWLGIFDTHFIVDPAENLILILLTQTLPSKADVKLKFRNLAYQALR